MKHLKYFESVTVEDVIGCIEDENMLYIKAVPGLPDHNPEEAVRPVSITDDGIISLEINGEYHDASLRNVTKILREY